MTQQPKAMDDVEVLYQKWQADYQALEALAPLTAADALKVGGRVFEQQMRQAVEAGAYSQRWIEQLNQFSMMLSDWCAEFGPQLSYQQRNRFLGLQDDAWQINPEKVLRQPGAVAMTSPDTVADQLAEGATLCQLF